MGACDFFDVGEGSTAKEAFHKLLEHALYTEGHGGYSGTIAEKYEFVMIDLPNGKEAYDYAEELMDEDDPRISDKWGPAGCIKMEKGKYLFFGMASS